MTTRNQGPTKLLAKVTALIAFMVGVAPAQFMVGPSIEYGSGLSPSGMTNGDFDGDSDQDLATTTGGLERVVVLKNAGNGTFGTMMDSLLPASSSPQGLIAGDLDGDLDLDLAVALRDDPNGAVRIMLNDGTGAFSMAASIAVGDRPRGLSLADMDGDLDLDLAVANRNSDTVSILTNDGSANFSAAHVATGGEPRDTAFGNFLGDSRLELAVTNHDDRTVSVFSNNGTSFTPVMTMQVGNPIRPDGITAADLNGDGFDDLAVATSHFNNPGDLANFATVFLNDGGSFNNPLHYDTNGTNSSEIITADLDCNGSLDLVVSNTDSNDISLLANSGNGTFADGQRVETGSEPGKATAGDWDGDRVFDLAVANTLSGDVSVLLNHTCTFAPADFNADGQLNCDDVDALVAVIAAGSNTALFDLTGDGAVNTNDLDQWLADAGAANLMSGNAYLKGDANLDGTVDGADFIAWNANKFTSTPAWCSGDFNAGGFIDGQDFITWNANKFTSADGTVSAVPEPGSMSVLWLLLASMSIFSRRHRAETYFQGRRG